MVKMANIAGRAIPACRTAGPVSRFAILIESGQAAPYLEAIKRVADAERDTLGFLPDRVYRDALFAGKLFVAIARDSGTDQYAGHLLFGGTYPFLRIFQVLVAPRFRRRRLASLLVQTLLKQAEEHGYLSIKARVAEDLSEANAFWEHEGFELIKRKSGGKSRGRTINIRARALETPTLFGTLPADAEPQCLLLSFPLSTPRPLYVIDLNVFLDLVKHRALNAETQRLIAAAWNRSIDVSVTEEFVVELRRATPASGADPVLDLALALPRLPHVPEALLQSLISELGTIVFPAKASTGHLSRNDCSDLIHLATAIHHGAVGFVTGERGF